MKFIILVWVCCFTALTSVAQIRRNPATAGESRERTVVDKFNPIVAEAESSPLFVEGNVMYVLDIDGAQVYITLENNNLSPNDDLAVYADGGYFIHPKTQKKIKKEGRVVARLRVDKVYGDYAVSSVQSFEAVKNINKGMSVRILSKSDKANTYSSHERLGQVISKSQELLNKNPQEEVLMWYIKLLKDACPIESGAMGYIKSCNIEGNIIVINHVVTVSKVYKSLKKLISKGDLKDIAEQAKLDLFPLLAKKCGYKITHKWYNKEKSEFVEYSI